MHEETWRANMAALHMSGCITIGALVYELTVRGFRLEIKENYGTFKVNAVIHEFEEYKSTVEHTVEGSTLVDALNKLMVLVKDV